MLVRTSSTNSSPGLFSNTSRWRMRDNVKLGQLGGEVDIGCAAAAQDVAEVLNQLAPEAALVLVELVHQLVALRAFLLGGHRGCVAWRR